jgi:hypothetical protein
MLSRIFRVEGKGLRRRKLEKGILSRILGEEEFEVFALEVAEQAVVLTEDGVREFAFRVLEFEDLFFNRVAGDEAVGEDIAGLADAVGAVDGLSLNGGVPPGIEEEDISGGGQIEAKAAGTEADEEELAGGVVLEALDTCLAVAGGAVEIFIGEAGFVEA